MIFTRKNSPPGYYVYLYLREDGTPYYCGKGSGQRAWSKDRITSIPINPSLIVIVAYNLFELWAFGLERRFIRWYGRKDNNTGILDNLTDGGDGVSGLDSAVYKRMAEKRIGVPLSLKWRNNISAGSKGVKKGPQSVAHIASVSKSLTGKTKSVAHRQNISAGSKGIKKPCSAEHAKSLSVAMKASWEKRRAAKAALLSSN